MSVRLPVHGVVPRADAASDGAGPVAGVTADAADRTAAGIVVAVARAARRGIPAIPAARPRTGTVTSTSTVTVVHEHVTTVAP